MRTIPHDSEAECIDLFVDNRVFSLFAVACLHFPGFYSRKTNYSGKMSKNLDVLMLLLLMPLYAHKADSIEVNGAGATFPNDVYQAWIPAYRFVCRSSKSPSVRKDRTRKYWLQRPIHVYIEIRQNRKWNSRWFDIWVLNRKKKRNMSSHIQFTTHLLYKCMLHECNLFCIDHYSRHTRGSNFSLFWSSSSHIIFLS